MLPTKVEAPKAVCWITKLSESELAQSNVAQVRSEQPSDVVAKPLTWLIKSFQERVEPWMDVCFGSRISADRRERNHRFFEEAAELVQAGGMSRSEAHQLIDYVYGRPVGELKQEVGGVMVTLAALCLANYIDMHDCGETELARIWTMVEQIRAKQAAKPAHSPLPEAVAPVENEWHVRWYGSEPQRGWSIVAGRDLIAYIGGDESMSDAVQAIVTEHNNATATRTTITIEQETPILAIDLLAEVYAKATPSERRAALRIVESEVEAEGVIQSADELVARSPSEKAAYLEGVEEGRIREKRDAANAASSKGVASHD